MTSTIQKQQEVEPMIHKNAPLKQALKHIELKMQQQAEELELAGKPLVSHVPVSIGTEDSSSTLSSLSSKEGSEIGYGITRPAKKARTISNDSTHAIHLTSDYGPLDSSLKAASSPSQEKQSSPLLLAQDEDEENLSPLHAFVRKQIEVFTVTPTELAQPAPGRKQPIQLHQVGFRCIHCRDFPSLGSRKNRVKRAVCYPSAIGRIYHSVSDMKSDHFSHCKSVPPEVRQTFEALKADAKSAQKDKQSKSRNGENKRGNSSSSTSEYYRDSAARMGLVDGPGRIYMVTAQSRSKNAVSTPVITPNVPQQILQSPSMAQNVLQQQQEEYRKLHIQQQSFATVNSAAVASMLFPPIPMPGMLPANTGKENLGLGINHLTTAMSSSLLQSLLMNAVAAGAHAQRSIDADIVRVEQQQISAMHLSQQNPLKQPLESSPGTHASVGKIVLPLAAPEDANDLNPLHCFVRKHVELFSADKNDTEAPCPGRKTRVTLGQVGIRCKHCAKLNFKPRERVKRAACYPPSIDGIYQSVSNMKFDHFGICPSLPPKAKEELAQLKASYSGRNIGSTKTAKYYRESAVSKGLIDTNKGIRFRDTCIPAISVPQPLLARTDIAEGPTRFSALMMAAATHAPSI